MTRSLAASYVLDASVAAKWFTRHHEADRERAVALRVWHQTGVCRLAFPDFGFLEVLNALRFSGKATEQDAQNALESLRRLRLDVVTADWALFRQATSLSWSFRIALYDAAYVALADRLGTQLVTADEALVKRLPGDPRVLRLADMALEAGM